MNEPLLAAGALALIAAGVHGGVGDRIVRRIDEQVLPGNPFEGIPTKLLIRVTWHVTTTAFAVLGVALVAVGIAPELAAATGVAYVGGAAFSIWGVLTITAALRRGRLRALKAHPAPLAFLLTAGLVWWGVARL